MGHKKQQSNDIYWIGGSPCSGKSSIADLIAERNDFFYYKCDDFLDHYIKVGCEKNIPIMKKFSEMDLNQTWLERSIHEQVHDEIEFYTEAFKIIQEEIILHNRENNNVIVEGAAILPENILKHQKNIKNYICIIPTPEFQIEKYKKREWVRHYLSECTNPEKAFENWMERDIKFAEIIGNSAKKHNLKLIVEDGEKSVLERYQEVVEYWNLSKSN